MEPREKSEKVRKGEKGNKKDRCEGRRDDKECVRKYEKAVKEVKRVFVKEGATRKNRSEKVREAGDGGR